MKLRPNDSSLKEKVNKSKQMIVDKLIKEGDSLCDEEYWENALNSYTKALKFNPENPLLKEKIDKTKEMRAFETGLIAKGLMKHKGKWMIRDEKEKIYYTEKKPVKYQGKKRTGSRIKANEAKAIATLRIIYNACETFRPRQIPPTYPPSLVFLGAPVPPYIDSRLAGATTPETAIHGYYYTYTLLDHFHFTCTATPAVSGETGFRIFFTDKTGLIRLNDASGEIVKF